MMEDAIYYTFSSIATALGGTIAFLAAVVLFKLQGIDSEIREHAQNALLKLGNTEGLGALFAQARWAEFVHEIPQEQFGVVPGLKSWADRINVLVQNREKLVSALKLSVPLTLGVMILAVAVLPFAPGLSKCISLAESVLGVGVVLFGGCIASYWRLITALWR